MVKGHSRKPVPTAFGNITIDGVKDGQYSGDLARISSCTHTHTNTLTQIDWLFIYKPHGYGYPKLCTNNRSLITAQWMCVATIFTSNFYLCPSIRSILSCSHVEPLFPPWCASSNCTKGTSYHGADITIATISSMCIGNSDTFTRTALLLLPFLSQSDDLVTMSKRAREKVNALL